MGFSTDLESIRHAEIQKLPIEKVITLCAIATTPHPTPTQSTWRPFMEPITCDERIL
jgi:hypothetical protein